MLDQAVQTRTTKYEGLARALGIKYGIKGDDESVGVALIALCQASAIYDPSFGLTEEQFLKMTICNKVRNYRKRVLYERRKGLSGGAPTEEKVSAHPKRGRLVPKESEDDRVMHSVTNMEKTIVDRRDDAWKLELVDLIDRLPRELRPFATRRWVGQAKIHEVAEALGVTFNVARARIDRAEKYALMFRSGGGSK